MATPTPPPQPSPPAKRRRYPKLITFDNGRIIAHPLEHAPLHYPPLPTTTPLSRARRKKARLPPLRPQPAISEENLRWTEQEDHILRTELSTNNDWSKLAEKLPGRSADGVARRALALSGKRVARWGQKENSLLVDAYRTFGNDWHTIAKLLPGRSPLAVRKHFHGKIRDQFGFKVDAKLKTGKLGGKQAKDAAQ